MIQAILEQENKSFFFPRSMQIDLLKNCPQVIPTLSEWIYEEWHPYDNSLTKEKLINSFQSRLHSDAIPITLILLKDGTPVGTISLKRQKDPAFSDFPEDSIWMGSLQVIPEERNQGVGQALLKLSQSIAKLFGAQKLYFYTSNPTKVDWYLNRGAQIIDKRPFRGHTITVMELILR